MEVAAVIARATLATGLGIRYGLGKGGFNPGSPTPATSGQCDCSGFVAWSLGMSRKLNERFYSSFNGGWFETTAVWTDISRSVGIFESIREQRPGAVVVFPDTGGHHGHIGLVIQPGRIVHCSFGNDKTYGNAIHETNDDSFRNDMVLVGWLIGLQ